MAAHPSQSSTAPKPTHSSTSTGGACANNSSTAALAVNNDLTATPFPYAFSPSTISVKCGGTVKITNNTSTTHTMTPNNGGFSDTQIGSGSVSVRMSYKGTFSFYCAYHSNMTGKVTVTS